MRYVIIAAGVVIACVISFGCTPNATPQGAESTPEQDQAKAVDDANRATADNLWKDEISAYKTWSLMPGSNAMQENSRNPHGEFGTVYINDKALVASIDETAMPEGAILLRENFNEARTLLSLTAMERRSGTWFWLVYEPDGIVRTAGEIESCAGCHQNASRDGIYSTLKQ